MPGGGERSRESACLQCASTQLTGARRRQRRTRSMVHGENRTPYWIDRRLTGLAGPDYDATISFGLPFEPEDSQYGKYRVGSYRSVIAGAKLREGTIAILPRGGERSRESPCLQCGFTTLAGDLKTTKTDKKHGSRQESHLLLDRPAIDWPCRT